MSVPKSRRGESPAQYIDLAREIYVFTYNRVRLLPKAYTFYFSLPLYNAARTAYRLVKTANLIYIDPKQEGPVVERNKQRRRELYENAQGYYNKYARRARPRVYDRQSREDTAVRSETVGRYDYRRNLSNFQNQAERQRPIGRSRPVSI